MAVPAIADEKHRHRQTIWRYSWKSMSPQWCCIQRAEARHLSMKEPSYLSPSFFFFLSAFFVFFEVFAMGLGVCPAKPYVDIRLAAAAA